jgi:HD-GYP domain-containing protein (c-di-GMP phosphodiesterase class II)
MSLASQAAVAIRNATLIADIKALFEALIRYSATAIDARSPHTAGHSRRVADYSKAIALAINEQNTGPLAGVSFSREQLEELSYAAWLHDIGKIGVPEKILDKNNRLSDEAMESIINRFELIKAFSLGFMEADTKGSSTTEPSGEEAARQIEEELSLIQKANTSNFLSDEDLAALQSVASKTYKNLAGDTIPYLSDKEMEYLSVRKGNLTAEEYRRIQTHVELTYNIVENIPFTKSLQNIPFFSASHHELLDGSGYPKGLKGEEIPIQSRILAVVDIFDALTAADRPYRRAMAPEKAGEILKAEAKAGRLDSDVVNLFVDKELYEI